VRGPIPRLRWSIAALLCAACALNYLDRQTLSVLAATLQAELGFSDVDYSHVTSAFLFSYTVMYAVTGRLVDRLGTRRSFLIGVSGWSAVTMLHALARSALHLSLCRALLGAVQPVNFAAGVKAVSEWFPMRERALAVGIFNAGTALGGAIAVPVVSFVALRWGWRWAFVATGAAGFLWAGVWAAAYRLPADHPRLGAAERALIFSEGDRAPEAPAGGVSIGRLLRLRAAWGCILARALTDPISYFLYFWIPKYLQAERGFSLAALGRYGWIPFAALFAGNLFSGAMPLLCLSIVRVQRPGLALALMSALSFGHAAWGNITLPAEVFPARVVGTVTGLGGSLGGLTGILTQLAIGRVVQAFSFAPIFAAISAVYLVALALVHLLIGELGRLRDV